MSAPEPEPGEPNRNGQSAGHDEGPAEDEDTKRSAKAAAILGAGLALAALASTERVPHAPSWWARRSRWQTCSPCARSPGRPSRRRTSRKAPRARRPRERRPRERRKRPSPRRREAMPPPGGFFAAFKILILFGGLWLLLSRELVDLMPLVVGYGVLPLGIAASAVWSSLRSSR